MPPFFCVLQAAANTVYQSPAERKAITNPSSRPKVALLPPQWRDPRHLFLLLSLQSLLENQSISTPLQLGFPSQPDL
jgi:hypothetical protein